MQVTFKTYYRRMKHGGYTAEEAYHCPPRKPLWVYRVEQQEGRCIESLLKESASSAKITGHTLKDLADDWGVNYNTLGTWARKMSVKFPRCVSEHQKEAVSRCAHAMNQRRRASS